MVIVGGGINGAGIARDAAGRGLSVLLCEKDDLAQHTSSASTKLIHGGLRYLEYYEFGLVRKALRERELLLRMAPHIMWPLRFVMPHDASQRPAWMIRAGLFLYDHLAPRTFLPGSAGLSLVNHPAGLPLKAAFRRGFVYSDGWVDDARLVVLNAVCAAEHGAQILTRTRCVAAHAREGIWHVELQKEVQPEAQSKAQPKAQSSPRSGMPPEVLQVRARVLINAAGPWAGQFARMLPDTAVTQDVHLIKGSHIVVRRLFDHPMAYIFQNPDHRIIFALPYEQDFTLIGTTDLEYAGAIDQVQIERDEMAYLCDMANHYFTQQITPADVVHTYSGVRPLLDKPADSASAITRDYLLELTTEPAPLLTVWGGKITTYRKLAEDAMEKLRPILPHAQTAWTAQQPLPGGDLQRPGQLVDQPQFATYFAQFQRDYPWLPPSLARRYATGYGSRAVRILTAAQSLADLGEEIAPGLHEAELHYLIRSEWAVSADDILWRRTKQGLRCSPDDVVRLQTWLANTVSMS